MTSKQKGWSTTENRFVEEENPLLEMLRKYGYWKHRDLPSIEITEPITTENFKEFQQKLRALVPPHILEQWDKEDEELLKAQDDK